MPSRESRGRESPDGAVEVQQYPEIQNKVESYFKERSSNLPCHQSYYIVFFRCPFDFDSVVPVGLPLLLPLSCPDAVTHRPPPSALAGEFGPGCPCPTHFPCRQGKQKASRTDITNYDEPVFSFLRLYSQKRHEHLSIRAIECQTIQNIWRLPSTRTNNRSSIQTDDYFVSCPAIHPSIHPSGPR